MKNKVIQIHKLIVLIVLLNAVTTTGFAQRGNRYFGFGGSFGARSQTVFSNYKSLNKMSLQQYGASGAVIYGTRMALLKTEIGVYYSGSDVPHTTNLFELASSVNIYPTQFFRKKDRSVEPYLIAGIARNSNRFFGFYQMEDAGSKINYSVSIEPYVGKITAIQAAIGTGIELNLSLSDNYGFVRLFAEAKYSKLMTTENSSLLANTSLTNQLLTSVGVLFGQRR